MSLRGKPEAFFKLGSLTSYSSDSTTSDDSDTTSNRLCCSETLLSSSPPSSQPAPPPSKKSLSFRAVKKNKTAKRLGQKRAINKSQSCDLLQTTQKAPTELVTISISDLLNVCTMSTYKSSSSQQNRLLLSPPTPWPPTKPAKTYPKPSTSQLNETALAESASGTGPSVIDEPRRPLFSVTTSLSECHHTHLGDLRSFGNRNRAPRHEHWVKCVLPIHYPELSGEALSDMADSCSKAEGLDILLTVDLVREQSAKSASRKLLRESVSYQLPESDDETAEIKTIDHYLEPRDSPETSVLSNLVCEWTDYDRDKLKQLYHVPSYKEEAHRRFRAVKRVTDHLYVTSHTERMLMLESYSYRHILSTLTKQVQDPRSELVQRVAIFHTVLRTQMESGVYELKPLV